jgi:uncharacterized protein (DUF427 family)
VQGLALAQRLCGLHQNVALRDYVFACESSTPTCPKVMKAIWKDTVIAESDRTIVVEGNHYFPPESLKKEFFQPSQTHTTCSWKGVASYYDVKVNGEVNKDAAWYYPEPKAAAAHIKGYVAFWRGIKVVP